MLILTRKPGESVYIGDDIKITVVEIKGNQIRVGIDAPKDKRIYREEIYLQILEENQQAAMASRSSDEGLEGLSEAWKGRKSGPPRRSLAALSSGTGSAASGGSGKNGEEDSANGKGPVVERKKKR